MKVGVGCRMLLPGLKGPSGSRLSLLMMGGCFWLRFVPSYWSDFRGGTLMCRSRQIGQWSWLSVLFSGLSKRTSKCLNFYLNFFSNVFEVLRDGLD